jgi:hypothetical protein
VLSAAAVEQRQRIAGRETQHLNVAGDFVGQCDNVAGLEAGVDKKTRHKAAFVKR